MLPRPTIPALLVLLLVLAATADAWAIDPEANPGLVPTPAHDTDILLSGPAFHAKADSVVLLGADGTLEGRFETAQGDPDLQGWTPIDRTAPDNKWHISDWQAADLDPGTPGNHVWWCGETFDNPCMQGVGHNYRYGLDWEGPVAHPDSAVDVKVVARANIGIMDVGWDFLELQAWTEVGWSTITTLDGFQLDILIDEEFTLDPVDLVGPASDRVRLRWWVISDGGWDDEDCLGPGQVGAQLDLIRVFFRQQPGEDFALIGDEETCEPGDTLQWTPDYVEGAVGNFGQVWTGLDDLDPCAVNTSPQIAFIDDGLVVPETGGTPCITWCYGPGGYVVNPTGGVSGPDYRIESMVASPVLAWPDPTYGGLLLEFDVYRHFEIFTPSSSGIFYSWQVRTAGPGEDIQEQPWENDGFVYFGDPSYYRFSSDISEFVPYQAEQVQIGLGVLEAGWYWGWDSNDATPAPYFDNVRLTAYDLSGPIFFTYEHFLAQDGFPAQGFLDLDDLGSNSVRFDAARNVAPPGEPAIPTDSLVILAKDLASLTLDGDPTMHYRLYPNPLFDPFRTAIPPGAGNTAYDGVVACDSAYSSDDYLRFVVDLPDTGFFFPGDVIHYYYRATDTDAGVSILPADTTGFANPLPGQYDPMYTVRALPTAFSATPGAQPRILLWDDSGSEAERNAWLGGLSGLLLNQGYDYDIYTTRDPVRGEGNGLGAWPADLLSGYTTILYSAGVQDTFTIVALDPTRNWSSDTAVLESWLGLPNRTLLLMGDNLATALWHDPAPGSQPFLQDVMEVDWMARDVAPTIDNQVSIDVEPVLGDPVFAGAYWAIQGGCPGANTFDHITASPPAWRSAQFLAPGGVPDMYGAAAAVTAPYDEVPSGSTIITVPYGLASFQVAGVPGQAGDKSHVPYGVPSFLAHVLRYAGHTISDVPEASYDLSLAAWPNPFNPRTEIRYSLDAAGPVTVDLYDVRGRKVRALVDEVRPVGGSVAVWDGRDDGGRGVSSGVYFCVMKAESGHRAMKLTLLR